MASKLEIKAGQEAIQIQIADWPDPYAESISRIVLEAAEQVRKSEESRAIFAKDHEGSWVDKG